MSLCDHGQHATYHEALMTITNLCDQLSVSCTIVSLEKYIKQKYNH